MPIGIPLPSLGMPFSGTRSEDLQLAAAVRELAELLTPVLTTLAHDQGATDDRIKQLVIPKLPVSLEGYGSRPESVFREILVDATATVPVEGISVVVDGVEQRIPGTVGQVNVPIKEVAPVIFGLGDDLEGHDWSNHTLGVRQEKLVDYLLARKVLSKPIRPVTVRKVWHESIVLAVSYRVAALLREHEQVSEQAPKFQVISSYYTYHFHRSLGFTNVYCRARVKALPDKKVEDVSMHHEYFGHCSEDTLTFHPIYHCLPIAVNWDRVQTWTVSFQLGEIVVPEREYFEFAYHIRVDQDTKAPLPSQLVNIRADVQPRTRLLRVQFHGEIPKFIWYYENLLGWTPSYPPYSEQLSLKPDRVGSVERLLRVRAYKRSGIRWEYDLPFKSTDSEEIMEGD